MISLQNLSDELPKYITKFFFKGYYFNCNVFGHKASHCDINSTSHGQKKLSDVSNVFIMVTLQISAN